MNNVIPIVALDVPTIGAAQKLVAQVGDHCDFYKVGLELFAAEGPSVVYWLRGEGKRVFLDLKLHDIPNTVQSAARAVARLGASLLTVHASGGEAMIRAAVQGAREGSANGAQHPADGAQHPINGGGESATQCGILGVTVLTSMNAASVGAAWGRSNVSVEQEVLRLAGLVRSAGALGVVCSGHELSSLKQTYGRDVAALVPGIRLAGGDAHDQVRTMTPGAAAKAGADYLVIGRAVTGAANPAEAMALVWGELGAA